MNCSIQWTYSRTETSDKLQYSWVKMARGRVARESIKAFESYVRIKTDLPVVRIPQLP